MSLKANVVDELLGTDMTLLPSTFIVWLQQMPLELFARHKTLCTVSTWVRLCSSMNSNMMPQITVIFVPFSAVQTVIRPLAAVYMTFMALQSASFQKTFVTQWALVGPIFHMNSHMSVQTSRLSKRHLTDVTFVWFLSTVSSVVKGEITRCCESLVANSAFKRSLSWMTSHVHCQWMITWKTLSTLRALEFTSVHSNMWPQRKPTWITLPTLRTRVQDFLTVYCSVIIQTSFAFEFFVADCTQKWLLITVGFWVIAQSCAVSKPCIAQCTQIRSFSSVSSHVQLQTVGPYKSFVTHCTYMRFFSTMCFLMPEQSCFCRKLFIADTTRKQSVSVVWSFVILQIALLYKLPVTQSASKWLLFTVYLLVSTQMLSTCKPFVTHCA